MMNINREIESDMQKMLGVGKVCLATAASVFLHCQNI